MCCIGKIFGSKIIYIETFANITNKTIEDVENEETEPSKLKIKSNPYTREISYLTMDETTSEWIDVKQTDDRSRFRSKSIL